MALEVSIYQLLVVKAFSFFMLHDTSHLNVFLTASIIPSFSLHFCLKLVVIYLEIILTLHYLSTWYLFLLNLDFGFTGSIGSHVEIFDKSSMEAWSLFDYFCEVLSPKLL